MRKGFRDYEWRNMDTKKNNDLTYRQAKPQDKPYRIVDGRGLYLQVNPKTPRFPEGTKSWRYRYEMRVADKRINKILTIGLYPTISLEKARQKAEEARLLLAEGLDPAAKKQADKLAKQELDRNSFKAIATEWIKTNYGDSKSGKVAFQRLENYVFPFIGSNPIATLKGPDFLTVLRRIEDRNKLETAKRIRGLCSMIMRYAFACGIVESDPVTPLCSVLKSPQTKHFAAITDPECVGRLLRAIDEYSGTFVVKAALQIAPYVFVRPGELRLAKWSDIDLEKAEWRYTVGKTKSPHIVPLSRQVVAILKEELQPLTGTGIYLFPGLRSNTKPMSDMAMNQAIREMGFARDKMSPHGFRAMARTLLDEELGERLDYIEHQLAHNVRDPLGRAYNRTTHLPERARMMQRWADYLDALKAHKTPQEAKALVGDGWSSTGIKKEAPQKKEATKKRPTAKRVATSEAEEAS